MNFRILSSQMTDTAKNLAMGILADKAYDRLPILADAIEDGGRVLDRYESEALRCGRYPEVMPQLVDDMLAVLSTETAATLAVKEVGAVEAARVKAFRESAFARCGLRGSVYTVKRLMAGITRRRPKGSGSKRGLAARLESKLNELAARRWARECKGQRKPTPAQLADLMSRVETALAESQGRTTERRIDTDDVLAVAVKADRFGVYSLDGGSVTGGSYGYRWTTTTATAERMPGGVVRVVIDRSERREVVAPAKHWAAAMAATA